MNHLEGTIAFSHELGLRNNAGVHKLGQQFLLEINLLGRKQRWLSRARGSSRWNAVDDQFCHRHSPDLGDEQVLPGKQQTHVKAPFNSGRRHWPDQFVFPKSAGVTSFRFLGGNLKLPDPARLRIDSTPREQGYPVLSGPSSCRKSVACGELALLGGHPGHNQGLANAPRRNRRQRAASAASDATVGAVRPANPFPHARSQRNRGRNCVYLKMHRVPVHVSAAKVRLYRKMRRVPVPV